MKAVYKLRAVDRVMALIHKAQHEGRAIDYVMVTYEEYNELRSERDLRHNFDYSSCKHPTTAVRIITLERPGHNYGASFPRFMQFPRMGDVYLFGVELVVIPEQYHSWKVVG